ncbi:glutathione ABC transporter substrate-binding protein [Virgibacillus xinjiangensis]|uniref:Glutathione ABC transporter substrate-binding protein n=1 Tax=Virgibacillus xinjiangensis TaxID=393090 RepID=A0ABV7CXI7_9BACI
MKMTKKSLLLLAFALLLSLLLAACASEPDEGGDTGSEGNGEENADGDESAAGGNDLVIANLSDAVTLDPAGSNDTPSSDVQANIYETLVTQNQDMELQPGLAEEWELVEDNVWEFKLVEGVQFHDGTEFNAEAVKANIERVIDPEVASPRAFLYEMVTNVEAVDEYTVRITTEFPFSPLPSHLAHPGGGMVSPAVIEEDYAAMEEGEEPGSYINENPIGTGYFKFEKWEPGTEIVLVKNEDYWDGEAQLDSVTFRVVPEDQTRIAELLNGDIHISNPLSPSDVAQVENEEGVRVNRQGSVSTNYIGFNTQKEPFDDERVRQAISMAIDKEQIVEGIFDGVGEPANGPLAPDVFGYNEDLEPLEYDRERAQELLAEAGYEDGFSTTIWTNDSRERIDAATNIQAQLSEIGVDVEVEQLEWGAYLEQTANGEHDMFVLGWTTVTGDADYGLYPLFHSSQQGNPGNRTFTDHEELDNLLDEARREEDQATREELYAEAQQFIVEDAPWIFLHHSEYLLGVREEVKGLEQTPTQILQLKDVTIAQ